MIWLSYLNGIHGLANTESLTLYKLYEYASGGMTNDQLDTAFNWTSIEKSEMLGTVNKKMNVFQGAILGQKGVHLSAYFLVNAVLKNNPMVNATNANYLKGVEFVQKNVQMKHVFIMYGSQFSNIEAQNLFEVSNTYQSVSESQLATMHSLTSEDVNETRAVTIKNLVEIDIVIGVNTIENLFRFAVNYGNKNFLKFSYFNAL